MSITIGELKNLLQTASDDTDISDLLPKQVTVITPEMPTQAPMPSGVCVQIRHGVNIGDLISAMGCIKKYYAVTKRKAIVLQTCNGLAQYYAGAVHPVTDEYGRQVTCNQYMFDMAKPLIESQDYVERMEVYSGQRIDVDFDVIRGKTFVNMPHGTIQGWLPIAFPDLSFDISKPWIELRDECPTKIRGQVAGKVILNFTERYRMKIDYFFLQQYAPDLIFAGTEGEYAQFCNQWGLTIPRLDVGNFLELAYALKECRFLLSNQSMCWNLAQAMGVKRVLEMCSYADNCFPNIGEGSEGGFYQLNIEYHFRTMYNQTFGK